MPTYVCSIPEDLVDDTGKAAIAAAISRIHSEETGAPAYFVQVAIEEKAPGTRFLGGTRSSDQIWIRGDIRAGRSQAQRKALMLRVMHEVAAITGVPCDKIWVYLCNLEPTDMVEYGHVLPAPGEEAEWYARLPKPLQDYLAGLGTTRDAFRL